MTEDGFRVVVICEDEAHFRVVSALIDTRTLATFEWLRGILDNVRSWRAEPGRPDRRYMKCGGQASRWSEPLVRLDDGTVIRLHGHIAGRPLLPEANMWREALAFAARQRPLPAAVVLVRDLDGYSDRRLGMLQVRDNLPWPPAMPIVIATPNPEIEAWIVAGFVPADSPEQQRLSELSRVLCFDPTIDSHRLTSHPNTAETDAKRVLEVLTDGVFERQERCVADSAVLADRGERNYCRSFLEEIDQRLLPVFGPPES